MSESSTPQDRPARQPFKPMSTTGKEPKLDALLRIAHALEYLASQVHELQVSEHLIALSKSKSVYIPPD
jgi:hypothetical protein